jgi:DNA-directed RNA polymerases I, II, and III subunit RPABC1
MENFDALHRSTFDTLYKIFHNVIKMLQTRGYKETFLDSLLGLDVEHIQTNIQKGTINISVDHETEDKQVYVFFVWTPGVSYKKQKFVTHLQNIITQMKEDKFKNIIFIYNCKHSFDKFIAEQNQEHMHDPKGYQIEFFEYNYFYIPVVDHTLNPTVEILSIEERNKVFTQYNCSASTLPAIKDTDPLIRWYGLKPGTVCRMIRQNPLTGLSISYSTVIFDSQRDKKKK